jgi:hypothetical protein
MSSGQLKPHRGFNSVLCANQKWICGAVKQEWNSKSNTRKVWGIWQARQTQGLRGQG